MQGHGHLPLSLSDQRISNKQEKAEPFHIDAHTQTNRLDYFVQERRRKEKRIKR
jgi:hypothetical protein